MSGDVQPRKRKDKKKKKEDGDPFPEKIPTPIFTNNTVTTDDVNIHVHKEGGTGGGICAKLVFFLLFSALAVVIGLIITEHRGLTDIDTVDENSKFAQIFEGWVDTNGGDHHDVEEDADGHYEDDSRDHDDDEDDDHGDDHDDDHEDDDLEDDDHEDNLSEVDEYEKEQSEEEEDDDDDGHRDQELDDEDEDTNEDEDPIDEEDEVIKYNPYAIKSKKTIIVASEEDERDQDEDQEEDDDDNDDNDNNDDDDDNYDDGDKDTDNADEVINDDQDENDNEDDIEESDQNDQEYENDEEEDNLVTSRGKREISKEKFATEGVDNEDDNEDDDNEDETDDFANGNDENGNIDDEIADNDDDDNEIDDIDDGVGDKLDSSEKDAIEEQKIPVGKEDEKDLNKEEGDTADKVIPAEPDIEEDVLESSGMAVKLGVGVALLVVAHLVLVKKWRTVSNDDDNTTDVSSVPKIQDRRNTIIVPPSFKEVEPDIEQVQEEYSEEEDVDEDERVETNKAKKKYQELTTAYIRPPASNRMFEANKSPGSYEYEDEQEIDDEQEDEEPEDEELEEEEEEGEFDEGDGEEYDEEVEDDEDEELLKRLEARYGNLQKEKARKAADKRESDSDKQSDEDDDYSHLTNEDDYKIKKEIDEAQNFIKNNNAVAIALFDKILQTFPSSPRSLYGKALALDHLAEEKKSNKILQKALLIYEKLLKTEKVPHALFHLAADRCIDRWRFLGQYMNAINIHKILINRFPNYPKYLNGLAVTYLTINRVEEARAIFKQVLIEWPEDGYALVHYGFILKTADNNFKKAVRYLEKGILTKDEGVIDGRFYFHLGDALTRLSRRDDALKIYEEGARNKVFLSKYQRSLYNVPRLTAKAWWSSKDVPYVKSLKLLSESWKKIRDEGFAIINEKGYFKDESENLKDTGEWKQFELFARGHKNVKNCKKCPFTCSIIDQIPEASTCRRGQTKFSVMHPGTHVWPHCGPTNCRLRMHLGLKVPTNTLIKVETETRSWKEGDLLIFDDSFEHEVWHNGTDFRLILIVDVWHPELTPSERNSLSPI